MIVRLLFILQIFILCGCVDPGEQKPAPVTIYGQSSGVGSAGVHNVSAGDTLYTISSAYHLPMRDIVLLNHLKAPFRLYEGQRLKMPPPQEYMVRSGDTIYDVSRIFGVNSSEIARLNKMRAPYSLHDGQILRLPSLTRKTQLAKLKKIQNTDHGSVTKKEGSVKAIEREILDASHKPAQEIITSDTTQEGIVPPQKPQKPQKPELKKVSRVSAKTPPRSSSKFLRPVNGKIISNFGPKASGLHNDGINIAAQKGTPVRAAENGVVVYAGNELKGSGNLVLIRHEDQWVTAYAHMDRIDIRKGDIVKRGETVGAVGSTGSVNEPQLHFEIRRGTDAINPKNYLEGE